MVLVVLVPKGRGSQSPASVLVLRRDAVGHEHFVTPSWIPVVGGGVPPAAELPRRRGFLRSAILLAAGTARYGVNRLLTGPNGPLDTRRLEVTHPDVEPATGAGPVRRERRRPWERTAYRRRVTSFAVSALAPARGTLMRTV